MHHQEEANMTKGKRGRPRKFVDKRLVHVWVEREVLDRLIKLVEKFEEADAKRVSRGDVVTLAVDMLAMKYRIKG